MVAILDSFFDNLKDISTSQWFYLVILVIAYLDSMIPIVPSETAVILGGIAAGQGDLNIIIVIACGTLGAALGDNTSYSIGRHYSARIERWYANKPSRAKRLAWADSQLRTRGGSLLLTARFIPGGRTVVTLASGITRQRRVKFVLFDGIACLVWASYAAGLGYFFGTQFEDSHTKAFLVAFATAVGLSAILEVIRHFLRKRKEASAVAA
jgi:membrane-associated protein